MAATNVLRSAMGLSALAIAAGTILSLSARAAAQSRPESRHSDGEQTVRVERGDGQIRVFVNGREIGIPEEGAAGERRIRIERPGGDDGERRDRRVVIRRRAGGEGEGRGGRDAAMGEERCPVCGRPMGEDGQGRAEIRLRELSGRGEGGPRVLWFGEQGGPEGRPHVEAFAEPHGGHPGVHVSGRAIVIGPDGERHEFNIGGDPEDGPRRHGAVEHDRVIRLRMDGRDGEEGGPEGQGDAAPRIELRGLGGDGPGPVRGRVIIVGPDGRRREFNLGGEHGGDGVRIEEFRDGDEAPAHHHGERTHGSDGGHVIEVRKVVLGGVTL